MSGHIDVPWVHINQEQIGTYRPIVLPRCQPLLENVTIPSYGTPGFGVELVCDDNDGWHLDRSDSGQDSNLGGSGMGQAAEVLTSPINDIFRLNWSTWVPFCHHHHHHYHYYRRRCCRRCCCRCRGDFLPEN